MHDLLVPGISVAEKIVRSVVVYGFVLLAFRVSGKRQVGQLTPFDLVVLLILSNVVQNALIGRDDSLTGGLIGAATILALNYAMVEIAYRSRRARRCWRPTRRSSSTTAVSSTTTSGGSASRSRTSRRRSGATACSTSSRSGSRSWRRAAASA